MNELNQGGAETDYSATLFLPQTEFPMRAGLPDREPVWLKRWEDLDIYGRQRAAAQGKRKFTLHDGPPYANGNIHIGHALNKILKDLVSRSKTMLGYNSAYVPGWDCHGLPIEWKIEEQYRAKGQDKNQVEINEFRAECRTFAQYWVDIQREEFKRLGVLGDWGNPYLTMSFDAEAQIAREIMKVAASGQLYRGSKPVMWSVVERTALAEAEIEYADYESDTIWVGFPVKRSTASALQAPNTEIVIWTTTPWTIPANRAISFSSKLEYVVLVPRSPATPDASAEDKVLIAGSADEYDANLAAINADRDKFVEKFGQRRFVVAERLVPDFLKSIGGYENSTFDRLPVSADGLAHTICSHPLTGLGGGYDFDVPLLDGDHVTDDAGTGFVHTAPGHGLDDFEVWMSSARKLAELDIDASIPFTVDDAGFYTTAVPGFEGARVLDDNGKSGDANRRVGDKLAELGRLVRYRKVKHQYPHSWRSKKPIIYRNTPQWFVYMDKPIAVAKAPSPGAVAPTSPPEGEVVLGQDSATSHLSLGGEVARRAGEVALPDTLRNRALAAIDATKFYPAAGQTRLRSMIADRPDWVLSRQRAWGVPIAVFYNVATNTILTDETVNHRIAAAFEEEGADAWFKPGAKERFLGNAVPNPDDWLKIDDILDVWFESGTTHAWVLKNKQKWPDLQFPAGMYLEGSDQHRGWFHSSLLESCATNGYAPYASVLTHGFTLDGEGKKMSKSLGNTVAPQDIVKQYGADILRLWVASTDYADDQRIGKEIINSTVDNYRKLRNTIRWLLGNLAHYKKGEAVDYRDMPELERLVLHRLKELDGVVREAYEQYDYKRIIAALSNFMNIELSAFYFDIRKDALYCDPISATRRKASLTVLDHVFDALTAWLAPVLVFTMEEAWLERHPGADESVHLREFPVQPAEWLDRELAAKWDKVREVRKVVTGALEIARREKVIGSSLEAAPKVFIADPALAAAVRGVDLAEVAITSGIEVTDAEGPAEAFRLDEVRGVAVQFQKTGGVQCARSRRFFPASEMDTEFPELSRRDGDAMRERRAAGL